MNDHKVTLKSGVVWEGELLRDDHMVEMRTEDGVHVSMRRATIERVERLGEKDGMALYNAVQHAKVTTYWTKPEAFQMYGVTIGGVPVTACYMNHGYAVMIRDKINAAINESRSATTYLGEMLTYSDGSLQTHTPEEG